MSLDEIKPKQVKNIDATRQGIIVITPEILFDRKGNVIMRKHLFSELTILHCHYDDKKKAYQYIAICKHFRKLKPGANIPVYNVTAHTKNGKFSHLTFEEVKVDEKQ